MSTLVRESDIKRAVKLLFESVGFWVYSLSQDRPSHQTPGLPDLYALHLTKGSVWIETKAPDGRTSEAQDIFADRCAAAGQRYLCCASLEAAHAFLLRIGILCKP